MENKFVIIDLETTGHSPEAGDRIIEVGIVVIKDDKIDMSYSTLINPQKFIPSFISNLTGITNSDVSEAPTFAEKADEIIELFHNAYFVAHNVPFDLRFLNYELTNLNKMPLDNKVLDTVELSRILFPQAGGYKLNQLATFLNITHEDPHRALSDALVTADLFLKLKDKLQNLPYETIVQLLKLENIFHSDLYTLLNKQQNKLAFLTTEPGNITSYQGVAFKNVFNNYTDSTKSYAESFGHLIDNIYEANGLMEKTVVHYEQREEQRDISEIIFDAFEGQKHAIIEAGTGIGKTIAYLIPAIYKSIMTDERIVISTYTTQLQAQLLYEELPLVQKIIPFSFKAAMLKGKHHYISLERFSLELANEQTDDNYDIALTKAMILVWLTETDTGDIDEIHLPTSGYFFYNQVSTRSEGRIDPTSPWMEFSYYQYARKKARQANIVVTNHALLSIDLDNDYQFIPSYNFAIIDEAHHFEHAVSRQSSLTISYIKLQYSLNQIGTTNEFKWIAKLYNAFPVINESLTGDQWNERLDQTKYDIDCLFEAIHTFVTQKKAYERSRSDIGRIQYRLDEPVVHNTTWEGIKEISRRVNFSLKNLIKLLQAINHVLQENGLLTKQVEDDLKYFSELLQSFINKFEQFFILEADKSVKWIEVEGDGIVYLYQEATDVSNYLATNFFAQKKSIILTSATLTIRKSFSHILRRLGLSGEEVITKDITSPFDYANQVQFLVPNDFPHIVHDNIDDFIYSTCEAIVSLAHITKGRILVLFTSYEMLKKCYHLLKETISTDDYMIIAQGISSGSRSRLKKNFQSFSNAILLGTSSFWEGVDIPGEDLSSLIIVRLPFQPPTHPVYEARANELKGQGKNAFYDLSLPEAVIRFKQGFGRLIRSKKDRGIVFVCDARIVTARYGKVFTDSIPNLEITYDSTSSLMKKAEKWF